MLNEKMNELARNGEVFVSREIAASIMQNFYREHGLHCLISDVYGNQLKMICFI